MLLRAFGPRVTRLLQTAGYFDLTETATRDQVEAVLDTRFWKSFSEIAKAKNAEIWPEVWDLVGEDALLGAAQIAAEQLSVTLPEQIGSIARGDMLPWARRYYESRGLQFVKQLSQTDKQRLKGYVWSHIGENERDFVQFMRDEAYICSEGRLRVIKRTEAHTASTGGMFNFGRQAGAKWKTWLTASDARVRPSHRILYGVTVAIDAPFPNGRMFPDEVNCRCHLAFSF
jgi:hypothetical protein